MLFCFPWLEQSLSGRSPSAARRVRAGPVLPSPAMGSGLETSHRAGWDVAWVRGSTCPSEVLGAVLGLWGPFLRSCSEAGAKQLCRGRRWEVWSSKEGHRDRAELSPTFSDTAVTHHVSQDLPVPAWSPRSERGSRSVPLGPLRASVHLSVPAGERSPAATALSQGAALPVASQQVCRSLCSRCPASCLSALINPLAAWETMINCFPGEKGLLVYLVRRSDGPNGGGEGGEWGCILSVAMVWNIYETV